MTIDIATHKTILFQLLKDIYTDTTISPYLGFKGGTAALMFYGLDRFSVDLDFDLLDAEKGDAVFARILQFSGSYGTVKEAMKKRFSYFCRLSYNEDSRNVKIELNRRQFGSVYEIKTYLGVSMQVMVIEDMFAHKLMAMYERMGSTSRDIYDTWFFLQKRFPLNQRIVEERAGLPFNDVIDRCILKLEGLSDRHILDGLGELLSPGRKDWARAKLKAETIALLQLRKIT